ncbi:MAG: hypothetical protein NTY09_13845 [bacterium]|nr:hypothetical protein [bacterium]
MASIIQKITLAVLLVILITGCSGSGNGVAPSMTDSTSSTQSIDPNLTPQSENGSEGSGANHFLLSYNLIYLDATDPDNIKAEIVPVREGEIHLNILKFLEDGPCTNCFKIVGFNFPQPGYLDVDIQIDHPFDDLLLSVFDVRGIIMFRGSHEFPVAGKSISDPTLGDGELLNPDGYTALYNGSTITAPVGPLQKYYPGNFATPIVPSSDINGYRYYISDDPANNRNAFYAASSDVQTFSLKLPTGPFILGYAVDANWWTPIETPVDNPLTDFDLNANCPEPWKIVVMEEPIGDGLTDQGGSTKLLIDVYDWQGKSTYHEPVVECPELFNGALPSTWLSDGSDYSRYQVTVSNTKLASEGDYKCLVGVEANENDPIGKPWLDLTAYQVVDLEVQPGTGPSINLTAPNGGETWYVGTQYNITWTYSNITGNVKIEYAKNGSNFDTVIAYSTPCSNGSFQWTPSTSDITAGAAGKIKITTLSMTPTVSDTSDAGFTVNSVPLINIIVTAPNGGETWYVGTQYNIIWTYSNITGNVKIEYAKDGTNFGTVIASDTLCDGSFLWTPSESDITVGSAGKIKITTLSMTPAVSDTSDAGFTVNSAPLINIIVTAPNGGETWCAGTQYNITWTYSNITGNVKIEYAKNGTDYYDTISSSTECDGDFLWTPTADQVTSGAAGKIKITTLSMTPTVSDTSDNGFTISSPPSAPDSLTASQGTECFNIIINWPIKQDENYNLYRSSDGINYALYVNDVMPPYYDPVEYDYNHYFYIVKAKNYCGESNESNHGEGWRRPPLSKPENVSASDGDGTVCSYIIITWDPVSGAKGYNLHRDNTITIPNVNSPYYDGPMDYNTHTYWIEAYNECGDNSQSNQDSGYAKFPPNAPTGVTASQGTYSGYVKIDWNHPTAGADYYWVCRTDIDGNNGQHWVVDQPSYDDHSVVGETHYDYWVQAWNDCGESCMSIHNEGWADCEGLQITPDNLTILKWFESQPAYDGPRLLWTYGVALIVPPPSPYYWEGEACNHYTQHAQNGSYWGECPSFIAALTGSYFNWGNCSKGTCVNMGTTCPGAVIYYWPNQPNSGDRHIAVFKDYVSGGFEVWDEHWYNCDGTYPVAGDGKGVTAKHTIYYSGSGLADGDQYYICHYSG